MQAKERALPHRRFPGLYAYEALRAAILGGGLDPGRIDIKEIADRLGVSSTPVRESLARLASERLILSIPG